MPEYIKKLRIYGELGILKKNKKTFAKLENKGQSCMFTGYCDSHAADTYRLYVFSTQRIVKARDVLWTNDKHKIKEEPKTELGRTFDIDIDKWIEEDDGIVDPNEMTIITDKKKTYLVI